MVKISDERHTIRKGRTSALNKIYSFWDDWGYEEGAVGIRYRGSGSSPETANRKHETQTTLNIFKLF